MAAGFIRPARGPSTPCSARARMMSRSAARPAAMRGGGGTSSSATARRAHDRVDAPAGLERRGHRWSRDSRRRAGRPGQRC